MDVKIKVDNNKHKRKESLPAQAGKRQFIAPGGPFRPENDKSWKNKIDGNDLALRPRHNRGFGYLIKYRIGAQ